MVKAFTAPKPEPKEVLLSDLKWEPVAKFKHIYVTEDSHPELKDNAFYYIEKDINENYPGIYFCNKKTWDNYTKSNYNHSVISDMQGLYFSLYKVLTMTYYDE